LVAAFLFIFANSGFALLMLWEMSQAKALVLHTQEVMMTLHEVGQLVRQAGAGQRGYLFTHDAQFLFGYQQAEQDLPASVEKLRTLVSDSPQQVSAINSLAMQTDKDLRRLASGLSQASSTNYPTSAELADSRLQTDSLMASVGPLLLQEREVLQERMAVVEWRNSLALILLSSGTVISMLAIGLMLYRMRVEARARSTELAGTDAALRESEQRFRRIFEESPLGIVLAETTSERIVQVNPAFSGMLGYAPDELIGTAMVEITHIDDLDLLRDVGQTGTRPGDLIEIRYLTRSGVVTWARVRVTALRTFDQRETLLLCLVEDITRQKQVEAELRQAQKMEAIGHLTGGIAHDFNNLLGIIIGNAEFLIDAVPANTEHADLAKEILTSALSGADLTRRLLAFARRQTLQPRLIDLNAYLPNHLAILRRLLGETIQLVTTLSATLWPIRADPSQVGDALLNLAINARDAMPHGGTLTIETANAQLDAGQPDVEVPGDYVVISVTDTGTGMPPEVLERVVEPFFSTKGPGAGSGLGLSMIYGFAKQSGGHLLIQSAPGRGTVVRLYLPRAQDAGVAQVARAAVVSLPAGDEAILVVDDNLAMRTVARRHLASLGYRVSEAESGPAALAVLQGDSSFDLLFTDVVIPDGMTGYQLATVAQARYPGLKVLFTTGYAGTVAGAEAVPPHPGATIRKPYRKQELAASVRTALEA
jgi:PAS domain S-box-containing protein